VPTTVPTASASPAKTATATPAPKPSASAPPKAAAAPAGIDEARALLRKGRFDDAARGFQSHLRDSKGATHSVQVLLACSSENVQKALKSVQSDELFILPIHYQGKACYRFGWGLYDSDAKAKIGLRTVPDYFNERGNKPKVLPLAEMVR